MKDNKLVKPHGDLCDCGLTYECSPALGCPNQSEKLEVPSLIYSNGHVGIGTPATSQKIHIVGVKRERPTLFQWIINKIKNITNTKQV